MGGNEKNMIRRPDSFKKWETYQHRGTTSQKDGGTAGDRGRPLYAASALGRPCPLEFVERVHATIRQRDVSTRELDARRESEQRGRLSDSSARHAVILADAASFSHAVAPRSAPLHRDCRLRNFERTRSPAKRLTFPSRCYEYHLFTGEIIFRERRATVSKFLKS